MLGQTQCAWQRYASGEGTHYKFASVDLTSRQQLRLLV